MFQFQTKSAAIKQLTPYDKNHSVIRFVMEITHERNAGIPPADVVVGRYDAQLRQVSDALELATTTDDPVVIATAKAALADFFSSESTVGPFDPTKPHTHRQRPLVYVLSGKGPSNGLSPDLFTAEEARVASIFTKFCTDSDGAMKLYLCKTRYHSMDSSRRVPTWHGRAYLTQSLVLLSPWTQLAAAEARSTIQVSGFYDEDENPANAMTNVEEEVAPWGLFERPGFEFDDQTGTETRESWHAGTALVLVPIQLRGLLEFAGNEDAMLDHWLSLVDSHPLLAVSVMEALGGELNQWTLSCPLGTRVLNGIKKLRSVCALVGLLQCGDSVEYQPAMRDAVSVFTTEELVAVLRSLWSPSSSNFSSCLNTVASMVHDETDVTRIAQLLDALPLQPSSWQSFRHPPGAVDQTHEEFARLLHVALRVSVDRAKALATATGRFSAKRDAVTIARAVRVLVDWHGGPPAYGEDVLELVRHAHAQLAAVLLEIRNLPYLQYYWMRCDATGDCGLCERLKAFVKSTDETAAFDKLVCEAHFLDQLQRMHAMNTFTMEDVEDAMTPRILLTKSYETDDFKQAQQHAMALQALM